MVDDDPQTIKRFVGFSVSCNFFRLLITVCVLMAAKLITEMVTLCIDFHGWLDMTHLEELQ